ncbi:cytochrome c oxidase subunit II [Amaricoccus solimangrovi]|uniref:cytochrome-c oxidase n=1 Tax=Amaricoccus solimangrovi TaxID=2589815 RepID=A0A501WRQ3_9RHOB|nr:cytochrome c oxidase subunit II [Amaricoccus solimangrovi]TPE51050.1 cytochrome c oxidase subunit II [Amaricoccus solimangrovi]
MSWLWPVDASAYADHVDLLLGGFTVLIVALSAPVFILMAVFAVKYRRGRVADRRHPVDNSVGLETSWALIPFILLLGFYVWATWLFVDLHRTPADALEIDVVAKQWMWKFQHPGGQREINTLHVPVGTPVTLRMASQDVIHSLFIPALRIKQDVVPGRYTTLSFTADRPGTWHLACAEFCGVDHSVMGGSFVTMTPDDYAAWLRTADTDATLAEAGAALFRSHGCSGCHGPSATVHAPPLEGLYGRPVPLEGGEVVTADAQYIRDSILLPRSQIAAGYPPIMPTFANQLGEEDVLRLVAYIQSLADARPEDRP